jgi:hypothetical protein
MADPIFSHLQRPALRANPFDGFNHTGQGVVLQHPKENVDMIAHAPNFASGRAELYACIYPRRGIGVRYGAQTVAEFERRIEHEGERRRPERNTTSIIAERFGRLIGA